VNLIGDHTDYQDGLCLPVAIDREVTVAWSPRPDGKVTARSAAFDGAVTLPADGSERPEGWGSTIAAVLEVLHERGRRAVGFDAQIASTIPVGSGLSSSAAFEVAVALAAAAVAAFPVAGRELALAAQEAEHRATGVPCGVMDQMAAVFGVAGHALLLDCRTLDVEPVPLPSAARIVVVHSGMPRRLAASEYAQRRAACEAAAARLGLRTLRDAAPGQVGDDPIARHVVHENGRVGAFAAELRRGDLDACGRLMLASHASLRDDFRVSTPELDLLVELAMQHGALGARLTGAGFGGCIVALVPAELDITAALAARYRARTGLDASAFPVEAVGGAGEAG